MAKRIKPLWDSVLVKMDEDSEKVVSGILFKPTDALETILRTGVVLDVGPGKLSKSGSHIPTGLEVGNGVVFNRFVASNTKSAEALHQFALEKDEALIKANDVLLVYDRKEGVSFS